MHRESTLTLPFIAAIATALLFAPAATFDFVNFDDTGYVTANPLVLSGLSPELLQAAFTSFIMDNWHPLTIISLAADVQLFGLNPAAMHTVNLLFHATNTALLCLLLQRMTPNRWLPFITAMIFGLHPLRIESVAWISERKDVLSTFFWLATTIAYVSYCRNRSVTRYLMIVLLFTLGLMAKPMLVTLPFTLLLLDYWPLRRIANYSPHTGSNPATSPLPFKSLVLEKIPLFGLTILTSVICYRAQENALAAVDISLTGRILRAADSIWEYLARTVAPVNLAAFYPPDPNGYFTLSKWLLLAAVILVSFLVVWHVRSKPWWAVGWAWFLGTLVPVLGLVQVGQQAFADRYTYIPHVGLLIALVWGIAEAMSAYTRLARGLAITSITCLSVISTMHMPTWQNSLRLWRHALATQTDHYVIRKNLAMAETQAGHTREAIPHLKKALELIPDAILARRDLGLLMLSTDDLAGAEEQFKASLALKPDWREANELLAMTRELSGDFAEAGNLWQDLHNAGETLNSSIGLAIAALADGDSGSAHTRLEAIDKTWPDWRQQMFSAAWAGATSNLSVTRNPPQAILNSLRLSRLDRENPQLIDLVAAAYASAGNFERARTYGQAASEIAKNTPDFQDILPAINERLGLYQSNRPYHQPQQH